MNTRIDGAHSRGHKKRERTRAQLIASAIDVIAANGEAFTVGDVTARAGTSHGTFYNYFDDREALIAAVVPEVLTNLAVEIGAQVDEDDPAARFATVTAMALHRAIVTPDETRLLLRLDAVQRAIVEAPAIDPLRQDIAAGFDAGRFVVGPEAAVLDGIIGTLFFASRRMLDEAVSEEYPIRVVAQLLGSLGIAPPEAYALAERSVAGVRASS